MMKETFNTKSLVMIAMFLEGYKLGKGDVLPLGTFDLDELWRVINYLNDTDR